MASQAGQHLSHKAGEATGQAQMKRDEYKERASETTNQAQMKKEEYKEEVGGQGQLKRDEYVDKASDASESAKESTGSTVESAQNYAIELKDQASVILQQTGEQMKSMAQGAAEAVRSTLGINNNNNTTDNISTSHNNNNNNNNNNAAASAANTTHGAQHPPRQ